MSSRDAILNSVRAARLPDTALPSVPSFSSQGMDIEALFRESLALMGGDVAAPAAARDVAGFIARQFPKAGRILSLVPEASYPSLEAGISPSSLEDVDVAIVRAGFGVAETGSVFLSERELHVNAVAYLAQHLVVLLDPADILVNLHEAYVRPEWRERAYGVLMSGPSATADIEGVLIRGAQGVRSLTVIFAKP